jgi:hypothetical protein
MSLTDLIATTPPAFTGMVIYVWENGAFPSSRQRAEIAAQNLKERCGNPRHERSSQRSNTIGGSVFTQTNLPRHSSAAKESTMAIRDLYKKAH